MLDSGDVILQGIYGVGRVCICVYIHTHVHKLVHVINANLGVYISLAISVENYLALLSLWITLSVGKTFLLPK